MFTVIVYSVFKVKYYEEFRVDLQAETVHNSLNLSKSLNYLKIIFKISKILKVSKSKSHRQIIRSAMTIAVSYSLYSSFQLISLNMLSLSVCNNTV